MPFSNGMDEKKLLNLIIGGVVIIALIVLVAWYVFPSKPAQKGPVKPVNKIENIKSTELPKGVPSDLPLEKDAKVLSNYNATSPDGTKVQATRSFESAKTAQANFDLYKDYLAKNKWTILGEVNDPAKSKSLAIFAKKGEGILNITIAPGSTGKTSIVDLSYLVTKAK